MTTEIVLAWINWIDVEDTEMLKELIDCPEQGLEAFASEYGDG